MQPEKNAPQTIDEYIAGYPKEIQVTLEQVRMTIKAAAPEAVEAIKYQLPTFVLKGNLVHFGAFKHHIGFYPAPTGLEQFKEALAPYESSKGAVRFPLDKPIPYTLITDIVKFRVEENLKKAKRVRSSGKQK